MKRACRTVLALGSMALLGVLLGGARCDVATGPPEARSALERQGRHVLQIAGGCGCHGENFAGWHAGGPDSDPRAAPYGERFLDPFGRVPASNITPDTETGIGGWSGDQIEQAITNGIAPGGDRLFPIMPSHAFHGMSHSDIRALIAYLHRLRPVRNAVPPPTVKQPPPPPIGPLPPAPEDRPTDSVELGRYLVQHVSGCADCHAPSAPGAGERTLIGQVLRTPGEPSIVAPNLTPDRETGLGAWSAAEIARYLRTGSRPGGGLAQGPMAGLIVTGFSHYTPEEARAVAAYLKSLPPVRHRPG